MKKMKKLLAVLIGLVLLVVIVVLIAWAMIDGIAKEGIQRGAAYALDVPTTVDKASVSLLNGQVGIRQLVVANPKDFDTPHLMKLDHFDVQVRPGSLLSDTVDVHHFELVGLDMNIQQKGATSNVQALLDNMNRKLGGASPAPSPGPSAPPASPSPSASPTAEKPKEAKKLKIDTITIKGIVAHVQVNPLGGPGPSVDVKAPDLVLTGVTRNDPDGITVEELSKRLLLATVTAVVNSGGGIIPADLVKGIQGGLDGLKGNLAAGAGALVEQTQKQVAGVLAGAGLDANALRDPLGSIGADKLPKLPGADANSGALKLPSVDSNKVGGLLRGLR